MERNHIKEGHRQKKILCIILLCLLFFSSNYLFYNQALGRFNSDLLAHINSALSDKAGYSSIRLLFRAANGIAGLKGIATLLSIIVVLIPIAGTWFAQKCMAISDSTIKYDYYSLLLAIIPICFVSSIYVPFFYPTFYGGVNKTITIATQPWHNSTYLLMKLLSFIVMGYYIELQQNYIKRISITTWVKFAVSLGIVNSVKPSFFVGFAPAMFIVLVVDFIRNKGKTFKQQLILGSAVLCSMPILFLQLGILYPSSSGDSGIETTARYFVQHIKDGIIIPCILTSLLFVIIVSWTLLCKRKWNRILTFGWLTFIISFSQRLFLRETGPRAGDGNFGWGVRFFVISLFIICYQSMLTSKEIFSKKWIILAFTSLALMTISGLVYYLILIGGSTYAI